MLKHVPVAVLLLLLYSVVSHSAIAKYVALDYVYGSNPQNNGCSESYNTCTSTSAVSSRGTASSCMSAGKNNLYVVAAARPEYKMYFYEYTNNCGQAINANVRSSSGWASAVSVNSGNRVMFLIVTDSNSDKPQEFLFDLTNAAKPPPQAPSPLPPDPTNPNEPLPVSSEYKGICTPGIGSSRVSGYSVIDFERRSVSESIPVNGAPFYLLYASDRFMPKEYVGQKIPSIGGWSVSSVHYYDHQRNTIFYGNGLISVLHYRPKLESFGNYALLDSDGKHYHFFDINGRHLSTLDAGSNKVVLKVLYTDDGKFVGIEDKFGKKNLISFTDRTITSSTGRITGFELGQDGLLSSIKNADGGRYEIKYHPNRLMSEFKTPGGKVSSFEYNEKGHVVMDRGANGKWLEIRYDDSEKNTTLIGTISSEGKYNFLNFVSDSERSTRVYQSGSRAVSMSASYKNGNSITIDSFGAQSVYVSSPDPQWGNELPYTSDVNSVVENLNLGWTHRKLYDGQNKRQIDVVSPKGGKKREFMILRGDSEKHSYVQYVTPLKNEVMINSYGLGLVSDIKAFDLNLVQFEYDSSGRLVRQKIHERVTTYNYDAQGNMVWLLAPDGQSLRFEYDSMGRVSKQISPNGAATLLTYDLDGNLVSLQTPTNKIHSFGINFDGQMISYSPPTDGVSERTRYDYDLDGLLSRIVRGDGKEVRIEREKISERVIKVASDDVAITYDYGVGDTGEKNNRPLKALTHDGIGLEYNYLWRLIRSIRTTGEVATNIAFTYGSDASVAAIDVAGRDGKNFQTKFVYDLDGRLHSVGNLQYIYGKSPVVLGSVLGTLKQEIAISGYGEVQAEAYSAGKTIVSKFEYSRNHTGKVVLVKDVLRGISTSYVYDSLGRLVEVVGKDGRRAYSYDDNGNRLSSTRGQITVKGTYDDQDRLISYGTSKYFYNNYGDLEKKEELESASGRILSTRYSYDSLGNLRKVILPDGKIVEYIIDGQSRRIGKKINGKLVQGFIYQNQYQIVAELDGTGKVIKRFYYGSKLNSPDYMSTGGKDYKIVSDQVGTPQMIVEAATGKVVETLNFDEFGINKFGKNSTFIPFGFAGGLLDSETGLVRFGARDYDPQLGRWTSKDPILFNGGDTNLYGYTFADPINFTDQSGKCITCFFGAAIGAGMNAYDAIQANGTTQQVLASALVGGTTGFIAGTGAGLIQAALLGAGTGYANNAINQIIFTGNVDNKKAIRAGVVSSVAALGGELAFGGLNRLFFENVSQAGGAAIGAALGFGVDSGIPNSRGNIVGRPQCE